MDLVFSGKALKVLEKLGNEGYFGKELVVLKNPPRSKLTKEVDIIYGFEESDRKDFIHHRNSGMNHIIAKILHDKKIAYGFSFSLVLNGDSAVIIGRMRQNVKLCRKYKVKMFIGSFAKSETEVRALEDLKVFGKVIGMIGAEVKDSLKVVSLKLEYKRKKKAGKFPVDGVEILS